jgi:hypothetical protein
MMKLKTLNHAVMYVILCRFVWCNDAIMDLRQVLVIELYIKVGVIFGNPISYKNIPSHTLLSM